MNCYLTVKHLIRTWTVNSEEGIVFNQNSARPKTSTMTSQKLRKHVCLIQAPFSSKLAPSNYYLCLSLVNDFVAEKLASREVCENRLSPPKETTISIRGKLWNYPHNGKKLSNISVHIWFKSDHFVYTKYNPQLNAKLMNFLLNVILCLLHELRSQLNLLFQSEIIK